MDRPKRPRPDANEAETVAELRESGLVVIRTSPLPGDEAHNPLDLFVGNPADGVPWLQVEIKPDIFAEFTTNEMAYFKMVGVWPQPFNLSWRRPVVAAVDAQAIIRALSELAKRMRR